MSKRRTHEDPETNIQISDVNNNNGINDDEEQGLAPLDYDESYFDVKTSIQVVTSYLSSNIFPKIALQHQLCYLVNNRIEVS
jgi:hypothetical protein